MSRTKTLPEEVQQGNKKMCTTPIKVKSKNPYNKKFTYISCGKCEQCRKAQKIQWTNRLKSEIEHYHTERGWNVGFFTLTYNEQHLPTIPKKFFKEGEYQKIPCFSYLDIRKFIDCIRTYIWRTYNKKDAIRWLITSEYGTSEEGTHRPHYHGIMLFEPTISNKLMYELIEDSWTGTTTHIKNNEKHKGERRECKGIIAPFEDFIPRDNYACGSYVAKYICKDLDFEDTTNGLFEHLTGKAKNHLRHFKPFHKQSIGLGKHLIDNKNEKQLKEMLEDGIDFTGSLTRAHTPMYIKNKILYTTCKRYNLQTHRFETIKKYSKFYFENKKLVYDIQLNKNIKLFEKLRTKEYFEQNKLITDKEIYLEQPNEIANKLIYDIGTDKLAEFYTKYFGLTWQKCKYGIADEELVFARYNPCADLEELPNINGYYYKQMNAAINFILSVKHLEQKKAINENDKEVERLRKFWQELKGIM